MIYFRMVLVAWRLAWPHILTPWRSPVLRWRMETYGVTDKSGRPLSAPEITAPIFLGFLFGKPAQLLRFLRWAASL